jgi:hypothetical protein
MAIILLGGVGFKKKNINGVKKLIVEYNMQKKCIIQLLHEKNFLDFLTALQERPNGQRIPTGQGALPTIS